MLNCFRDFLLYILRQNVPKNQTRKISDYIKYFYVLNCFGHSLIYILGQNVTRKSDKKNFEHYQVFIHNFLCQNDKIFMKIFELYLALNFLWQNVLVLTNCTLLMYSERITQ